MEQSLDQLMAFVQDRWFIIVVVIIAILIIVKVMKSVIKWLFILALAAAILIYGSNYTGEIKDIGAKIAEYTKEEAVKAFMGEAENAIYEVTEDGGYIVTSGSFTLEGKGGSSEAVLSFKGQSITIQLDDVLRAFIEGAKNAQSNPTGT